MDLTNHRRDILIERIITPILAERGFSVRAFPLEKCNRIWEYKKKEGDILYDIAIIDSYHYIDSFHYIDLSVETNAYGQRTVHAEKFAPQDRYSGDHNGWPYQDEPMFIKILEEMKGLLLDFGFQELERISVPTTKIGPTPDNNRYLRDHWKKVALKYREEWGLDSKTHEEQFEIIMEMIRNEEDKQFEEVESLLVDIAAVYSDFLLRYFGGKSTWIEDYNNFFLEEIGTHDGGCSPLLNIISIWEYKHYPTFEYIKKEYGYQTPQPQNKIISIFRPRK